jgi:hypothetical protein
VVAAHVEWAPATKERLLKAVTAQDKMLSGYFFGKILLRP